MVQFSRELWIEREDFEESPAKDYFRLYPGNLVRLRYAYVVKCIGADKDAQGNVIAVHCELLSNTKSGGVDAGKYKVKGNIHWVSAKHALECEVRLYDRLFKTEHPGAGDRDFLDDLNPDSKTVIRAFVEPGLATVAAEDRFQFERHGYFVADRIDSQPGRPIFNRAVTLRDSWGSAQSAR